MKLFGKSFILNMTFMITPVFSKIFIFIIRNFLRLGSPLNCRPIDEMYDGRSLSSNAWSHNWPLSRASSVEERKTPTEVAKRLNTAGSVVPLTRVKCLVSMTTPRDARMHGSAVTPAFVEFDMSAEGFGCLYVPSIAPQGPPTPSVVSGVVGGGDPVVIGGIGTGKSVSATYLSLNFMLECFGITFQISED